MSMVLACASVFSAGAETEAERNLKAFPPADEGMTRHVLMLPAHEQEDSLRVELKIGKTVKIDEREPLLFRR